MLLQERQRPRKLHDVNNDNWGGHPKGRSQDLTASAGLFNECALGHFFIFTFPEYIWDTLSTISSLETLWLTSRVGSNCPQYSYAGWTRSLIDWINRRQNDLATAAPVTPRFFRSLTSSRTPLRSSRSRDDSPKSYSDIFTGLWPVRRGSPGNWSTM
jgi:hypothetical protein